MKSKEEIIEYIENILKTEALEEDGCLYFIWENMEFRIDFTQGKMISSKWNIEVPLSGIKEFFEITMDNIEFCETFGITNKADYTDQIWLRTGW